VAIDENIEALATLTEGVTYPILVDLDHRLTELYAISNIPTVVWIDENERIARPNAAEFGTDTFAELTGVYCKPHMDQIRAWVAEGTVPDDADHTVADLEPDEIAARLHFRLAAYARRTGMADVADHHFDRAIALAPLDFTVVRAAMPLRGGDPFGPAFFELWDRYRDAGSPYHGIPRAAS